MSEEKIFRPTVLVGDDNNSITDKSFLQGLIMNACGNNKLYYPNAFMYKTNVKNGKVTERYKKIQNEVFFRAFTSICKYKEVCPEKACDISDATAAEYLLEKDARKRNGAIENVELIYNTKKTQQGIIYTCKRTGYNEIAFPVMVYGRKLGVFILGQIITDKGRANFKQKTDKLYEEIKREPKEDYDILTQDTLQELIDNITNAVTEIGAQLEKEYKERQRLYSIEKSDMLIDKFKRALPEIKKNNSTMKYTFPAVDNVKYYNELGRKIKECVSDLCKSVGLNRYAIFTPNDKNITLDNYEKLKNKSEILNFKKFAKENDGKSSICENASIYIENAENNYDFMVRSDTDIYPIFLAIKKDDMLPTDASAEERKLLKDSFKMVFSRFVSYAQMAGLEAKSEYFKVFLDSSMSVMRHELGQSNLGYNALIEKFKENRERTAERDDDPDIVREFFDQCDNFIKDSARYMQLTNLRIQSTKYLINFSKDNVTLFYPYEEFLFKWQQIFYHIVEDENLDFEFPEIAIWDNTRPRMYGDPLMIEQAAYNLTNNAIKYAIKGSVVSMDCHVNSDRTKYEIETVNLGHSHPENFDYEKLFGFGVRGENNKKEGSGIGLFLTRQIALQHGGGVKVKVKKLSEYDLSLIKPYIEAYESTENRVFCKDEKLYKALLKELEDKKAIISKYITRDIGNNEFVPMYVQKNIGKGTSKYIFTFWIPYEE